MQIWHQSLKGFVAFAIPYASLRNYSRLFRSDSRARDIEIIYFCLLTQLN